MRKAQNSKGFITITNKEIYAKIVSIEDFLRDTNEANNKEHVALRSYIDTKDEATNKRIDGQSIVLSGAIMVGMAALGGIAWILEFFKK